MTDRATFCGKQVMLDQKHFADAATVEAAEALCVLMNHGLCNWIDLDRSEYRALRSFRLGEGR